MPAAERIKNLHLSGDDNRLMGANGKLTAEAGTTLDLSAATVLLPEGMDGGDGGLTDGVYTNATVTVEDGRITALAAGSSSGGDGGGTGGTAGVTVVRDLKPNGTDGGAFPANQWTTRVLNTISGATATGATLAANQLTLPAGTYGCRFSAPALSVGRHKARLRDTTHGVTLVVGSAAYSTGSNFYDSSDSSGAGHFTLTQTSALELQHGNTGGQNSASIAFGASLGSDWPASGEQECYTILEVWPAP